MDQRPLGIFDSGVGGLTVAREIYRHLPYESTIYLGDTARVPYGPRSSETITRFSHEIVAFLLKKNVKAVIVACSTASALALESLKKTFPVPIYGVIEPATTKASQITKSHRIAIIGTKGTINSNVFSRQLSALNPNHQVLEQACPLLVPVIEEGILTGPILTQILESYLPPVINFLPDVLILGCTHYPLITSVISELFPNHPAIINPGESLAEYLSISLPHHLRANTKNKPYHHYFTTDNPDQFQKIAQTFLPEHHLISKQILI